MAPRKNRNKTKGKARKAVDPVFRPIKAEIVAARNKLRKQAKKKATKGTVHKRYLKLKAVHRALGFGALANIIN